MIARVHLFRFTAVFAALSSLSATPARAEGETENVCTQIMVYAVRQFCSLLPNGQTACQPVALTGPNPACQLPNPGQFKPVPLAPPTIQMPMAPPMAMPSPYPFMPPIAPPAPPAMQPYVPPVMPASPGTPYQTSPTTGQSVSPFGAAPSPFMPPPAAAPMNPAASAPSAPPAFPWPQAPAVAAPSAPTPSTPAIPWPQTTTSAPQSTPTTVAPVPAPQAPTTGPSASPAAPVAIDASAPEAVTPNLPDAPSMPPVVAEAVALFPFDSAELTPLGQQTLDTWLASAPSGVPVAVFGYADRLGPEDYNLALSWRRANAARSYLISKGKDSRDIRSEGRGEADPVKFCKGGPTDATKACLAPNRRVLITPE